MGCCSVVDTPVDAVPVEPDIRCSGGMYDADSLEAMGAYGGL